MVSVHTSSPPTVHAAYLRCLCDCSKCDSSGFDLDSRNSSWSISRLKKVLEKKRGHSRLLFKKVELLERQVSLNRHLAYTLRCVTSEHPRCFSKCNLKQTTTKKLPGTNFACIATSSPCFLPASNDEWPQHFAQTTAGANTSLSLRLRASYSHLGPMRAKRKHRWHCTCFRKVPSLTRFQRTVDGRVHRLLGTSMKAKIFLREDVLIAYDRAVGDAEVRPVGPTNGQ